MANAGQAPGTRQNRCVTSLPPRVRYALDQEIPEESISSALRILVMEALVARGWTEKKMSAEWHAFASKCARTGQDNPYYTRGMI